MYYYYYDTIFLIFVCLFFVVVLLLFFYSDASVHTNVADLVLILRPQQFQRSRMHFLGVNTKCINLTRGTSSKQDVPQWHVYPTFQAHSATQMCTGVRQNQFLFKAGHSPLTSKPIQHITPNI